MGAWGILFTENDDAADWLADFADAPSWSLVDEALELDEEYVEAPDASNALAAIEIVAAAKGSPSLLLATDLKQWAADQANDVEQLIGKATKAAHRVRDDSELSELWEESEEFEDWKKSVDETIARL